VVFWVRVTAVVVVSVLVAPDLFARLWGGRALVRGGMGLMVEG